MQCNACKRQFHEQPTGYSSYWADENENSKEAIAVGSQKCPSCKTLLVYIEKGHGTWTSEGGISIYEVEEREVIFPQGRRHKEIPNELPDHYRKDLIEARAVLQHSPKASAALSRRLLQHILHEEIGIRKRDLSMEIDAFIDSKSAPTYLTDAIDAVRQIGNFAAHPMKNTNTAEIAEVEEGEAEWTLEVIESLLDFACIQPIRLKARRDALNQKLSELGKPPLKINQHKP